MNFLILTVFYRKTPNLLHAERNSVSAIWYIPHFFFFNLCLFHRNRSLNTKSRNLSGRPKHTHMSKRGSKYLRTAAFQAAEVPPWLQKTRCLIRFTKNKEAEKKHLVAVSHAANKMIHVVFSVLKNRKPYKVQLVY